MTGANADDIPYGALILDLDGTLIGRNEKISPRVSEAIGEIPGHVKISIATGRESADVILYSRQLGLTTPQVCDNGALILDPVSGDALWSAPLGAKYAEGILAEFDRRRLVFIATHPGGTITDHQEFANWNITRISALDMLEPDADELVTQLAANPDLHVVKVSLPYNGLWAVDITKTGIDKAAAVRQLVDILGVDASHMIAAGDSYNDIPLLQACGLGIAMGDAPDELKDIADYIAPSVDDDGLAVAINEFVLPRL